MRLTCEEFTASPLILVSTFKVEGRDSVEPICRATHHRFVVDVAGTEKRLAAKAAKAGLA